VTQLAVFSVGNCQAQFLASVFSTVDNVESYAVGRRYGFDPMVGSAKPAYCSLQEFGTLLEEAARAGRTCILLEQMTPLAPPREFGRHINRVARIVRFPHLQAFAMWPGRIMSGELAAKVPAARIFAHDLAGIRKATMRADFPIDIAEFVAAEYPKQSLFHMWGHPNGTLLALILEGVLRQLDDYFDAREAERLLNLVRESQGIDNITHHPVDRNRGRAAGFNWVDEPAYTYWCDSLEAMRARDMAAAEDNARRSIEFDPSNGHVWALFSKVLDVNRKPIESEAAIRKALQLQPNSPGIAGAFARHLLRHGMPNRAQRAAEVARDRFPTDPSGFANLAEALFAQGRRDSGLVAVSDMLKRAKPHGAAFITLLRYMEANGLSSDAADICRQMESLLPNDEALRALAERYSQSKAIGVE